MLKFKPVYLNMGHIKIKIEKVGVWFYRRFFSIS